MPKKNYQNSLADKAMSDSRFQESAERDRVIQQLKDKVTSLTTRHKEAIRENQTLRDQLDFVELIGEPDPRKIPADKPTKGEAVACVVLGDWHCGEVVEPGTIDVPNEYNPAVFVKRAEKAFQKALLMIQLTQNFAKVDELIVAVLGDLVNNYLHPDMIEGNAIGPTEEVLLARDTLCGGINFLHTKGKFKRTRVVTCFGNHGRTTTKPRHATAYRTNYEWLLYEILKRDAEHANTGITWHTTRGYFNRQEIAGWNVRFSHGDAIRYEGGIGGITVPLRKAVKAWDEGRKADYDVMGHWHTYERLWNIVMCGTLVGYNAYSQAKKLQPQPPTQAYMCFDRKLGLILCEPLYVE